MPAVLTRRNGSASGDAIGRDPGRQRSLEMAEGFQWGPLVLFAAVMTFTPGPNVVLVTASSANFGFRRTVRQMLGITLGFGSMVLAAGFGLAGMVHAEPRAHAMLKYMATVYFLYLAWRIAGADARSTGTATRARPIGFLEAALFTWMNPKAWVSALGALAAYSTVGGDVPSQTSVIAGVLAAFCLLSCAVWAGFGTLIGRLIAEPRARMLFNWSMAGLLVLSLIPVLV
jgi:threonine/homoserine/homoserine lactone efflux protein